MQSVSLATLTKVAAIGGLITASSASVIKYFMDKKIRETKTYKRALEMVYNHEDTVKHLGQPIKEGRITIKNKNNDDVKKFSVNLKGSNTKAKLNCEFIIKDLDNKTELTKLEIKFSDLPSKTFVLHEIE